MSYLIGIDVGTTGVKCIIADEEGEIKSSRTVEYPLSTPRSGWAEQNPGDWWKATVSAISASLKEAELRGEDIGGVGLTGQMHGSVFLDDKQEVIRPAILWCDQRTAREVEEIHNIFGEKEFIQLTGNPALTGFTAPKILWLKKQEPQSYAKVKKILLPKDYIRFKLTGGFATDVSDASGTSLFEVKKRKWSEEVLSKLEIDKDFLAEVYESSQVTGKINQKTAQLTGLKAGIPVVAGGGDQAASAISCGIIKGGVVSVTLGTSGVIFASTDKMELDPQGRLHSFCHAVENKWHLMGVMLSAGGSLRWFRDTLGEQEKEEAKRKRIDPYEIMDQEASSVEPGSEGLIFLPYLSGERTPHADPYAKGVFFGLSLKHAKSHLIRAVLEGVGFGLKDSLELMKSLGMKIKEIRVVGGGARSGLWRKVLASQFEFPLTILKIEAGAAYGALLLAGVGCGVFSDIEEIDQIIKVKGVENPDKKQSKAYRDLYPRFKELYPQLKSSFKNISSI